MLLVLLRALAAALRLLLAAILATLIWASPRIWRIALAAVDRLEVAAVAGRRRWDTRRAAVVVDELPATRAITDLPHGSVRWSDLLRAESRR